MNSGTPAEGVHCREGQEIDGGARRRRFGSDTQWHVIEEDEPLDGTESRGQKSRREGPGR